MKHTTLGTLDVSRLGLGTMGMSAFYSGAGTDDAESTRTIRRALDLGVTFFDTAEIYGPFVNEELLGAALGADRDSVVVATKGGTLKHLDDNSYGFDGRPENMRIALEGSLQRLGTDHIDLYFAHEDDAATPLGETLEAFTKLIQEGKVRHIAASQYSAKRLDEALLISKENGFASYVALQDQYNLMERKGIEGEVAEVISAHGISVLPFFGLARGFLSGKYKPGVTVESVRAAAVVPYQNEKGWRTIEALEEIARHYASNPSAVALAWLRAQPSVSVPIASARTIDQLNEIVQVLELRIEDVARLSEITA